MRDLKEIVARRFNLVIFDFRSFFFFIILPLINALNFGNSYCCNEISNRGEKLHGYCSTDVVIATFFLFFFVSFSCTATNYYAWKSWIDCNLKHFVSTYSAFVSRARNSLCSKDRIRRFSIKQLNAISQGSFFFYE